MPLNPRTAKVRLKKTKAQDVAAAIKGEDTQPASKEAPPNTTDGVEKLTPRDLRRARRKARRLGIEALDDHDAFRQLQERGINLEGRDSVLDMVSGQSNGPVQEMPDALTPAVAAPVTIAEAAPPAAFVDDALRVQEIAKIQQGLVKRRRLRLGLLVLKVLFFVILPTCLVGNYYYNTASDMYETASEFVIQKSESNSASGVGGLFSGTGFATSQDSITVQGYLTSREAMARLDADHQFISHYQQDWIDDIQRLPAEATREDAFKLYQNKITVGFDPTEGIIRMAVVAATPEASQVFSEALIGYAEERIDNLSARVREDQMSGALESYQSAEAEMVLAQNRVLDLQQLRGVLSAEAEISAQMSIINSLELEREAKLLDLAEIMSNSQPNQARASVLEAEITRLAKRIDELRNAMTQSTDATASLARITGELKISEADLANRQLMLQTALQQMETARIEANRQVRYLSMGVTPVAPDVAKYPRKLENTALAFVIFLSIYILVSLTVSILREQVSV